MLLQERVPFLLPVLALGLLPLLLVQELLLALALPLASVLLPSSARLSLQQAWPLAWQPLASLLAWLLASPQP